MISLLKIRKLPGISRLLPFLAFLFTSYPGESQSGALFNSERVIRMELRTDFAAIESERTGKPEYHDGELIYRSSGRVKVILPVRVMARGNFRLNPANCSFPPLLLDFKKGDVEYTLFRGQNKLKLVTPCQTEEDVLDEYTIYKMYNQVTNMSLKARLVRLSYIDESSGKELFERYSFFLEDPDHAAARNDAKVFNNNSGPQSLNRDNYLKLALFQYMIGNMDWHVELGKNIEIIKPDDAGEGLYAVPYDFDFSAFVNAGYTKTKGLTGEIRYERRQYLGSCHTEEEFMKAFEFFNNLKPVFENIIRKQKYLDLADRKSVIEYVEDFYSFIGNSDVAISQFLSVCGLNDGSGSGN